ncbi:hypothetical protein D3C84_664400 [compost metagenome]
MAAMKVGAEANQQVQAAIAQCLGRDVGFELVHVDHHRQAGEIEAFQQARQDQLLEVLRGTDVECDRLQGRVERLGAGVTQVDAFEDLQHVGVHGAGFAGGAHARAGIDEQLVLKTGAQLFQAVAHGGLADAECLGYTGNAALLVHGDKYHEVLHVELSKQIAVQHPFRLIAFFALNMRKRVRKILAERWCQENA